MEPTSTSSGSDSRDPPEPPRPDSLPAKTPQGKNILFYMFPKTQVVSCKRNESYKSSLQTEFTKSHTPRQSSQILCFFTCLPEKSSMKKDGASTGMHLLCKIWSRNGFKATHVKKKNTQRLCAPTLHWFFRKACEAPQCNHCTSAPHRPETNGIAERAAGRVKEGTSSIL